jgi:hypothetical protein
LAIILGLFFSYTGVISSSKIFWISSTLACFFSIVFCAASFFVSYILVPAASAMSPRISIGAMLITFVIRPERERERERD